MKSYKDKQLLFGLLFLGLSAGFLGRGFEHIRFSFPATNDLNQAAAVIATQQNLVPSLPITPSITIGMVGDIMLDRGVKFKVNKYLCCLAETASGLCTAGICDSSTLLCPQLPAA